MPAELTDVEALVTEGKRLSLHMASAGKVNLAGRIELAYDSPQIILGDALDFRDAINFFANETPIAICTDHNVSDFIEPGDYAVYEWDHTTRNGNTYSLTLTFCLEPARVRL